MRVFVTGATGFIGGYLVQALRARGDDVVALVRSLPKAAPLRALGCELVEGDVADADAVKAGVAGTEAVFHVAGMYKVGIPAGERPAMHEANVVGTERVLDAAIAEGVERIVYVSTINVFGNTRGKVVDETYRRPLDDGFLSYYDETKFRAHEVALDRIAAGAPVVIVCPGGVYGPNDPSIQGMLVDRVRRGTQKVMTFPETGFNFLHVEDAAAGTLLAHDRGTLGETYVLGGEITTLGEAVLKVAEAANVKPPMFVPRWAALSGIPFAPLVTRAMGLPPNLRELIKAADGVTYWATDAKARSELGYAPRDLDTGLRDLLPAS